MKVVRSYSLNIITLSIASTSTRLEITTFEQFLFYLDFVMLLINLAISIFLNHLVGAVDLN